MFSEGGFGKERQRKITYRKYFNGKILMGDLLENWITCLQLSTLLSVRKCLMMVITEDKPSQHITASQGKNVNRAFLTEHVHTCSDKA